ncbi:hypothetical protein EDC04DRAFT_2879468 [Pisolithus marmoratus]|nr:hypothetical protein EDC04DRAFT_2879468 [Pisolithus marmoratus]
MAFSHLPRDPTLQGTIGNSLNQALGSHLTPGLNSRSALIHESSYRLTDSPPTLIDANGNARPNPAVTSSPHQAIHDFARKHAPDGPNALSSNTQIGKRRRDVEDLGDFENDPNHGSKHWTEEEKTELFKWLMGDGEDEHWNALRTAKNSCFRKCAAEVFGGKKTYQALKGCYERNFNLFKSIHAFETFHCAGSDRLREYERRIQLARKGGCDIGNVSARTIDHWHRTGWYNLFCSRWSEDPGCHAGSGIGIPMGNDDLDDDDRLSDIVEAAPSAPSIPIQPAARTFTHPSVDQRAHLSHLPLLPVPQSMLAACLQLLQAQAQHSKLKLEYLRRREEREEKESLTRREMERLRLEREQAEWEHNKESVKMKQRAQLATDLLNNPVVDNSVREAAVDYLKKLLSD